ncbi:MAG: putative porin [Mediterranea sp.]|jgi:hypothetical protein|nr:putative porin [Mediterranea sp.]
MRRALLILILTLFATGGNILHAQVPLSPQRIDENGRDQYGNQVDPSMIPENLDSANVEVKSLPPKLYMWRIKNVLGDREIVPADTMHHQFQNTGLTEGVNGHYNYLGNMGSPRQSRIFVERELTAPTIFMQTLNSFYRGPTNFLFTNSNVPYTNITYYKTGSNKVVGEEWFKSYFSVNANKRLAFGFNIDYLYARGYYQNQNTAYFNATVFGSYIGDRYQLQAIYSNNYFKTNENGGITDDRYITAPEEMAEGGRQFESTNMNTNLSRSTNRNHDFYAYLTHRYSIGFYRDVPRPKDATTPPQATAPKPRSVPQPREGIPERMIVPNDSLPPTRANDSIPATVSPEPNDSLPPAEMPLLTANDTLVEEYVPVTSFIHTLHVERARRSFNSGDTLYTSNAIPAVRDSTHYVGIKNTIGIALLEGFNKYAKAGLTVFASYNLGKYTLMGLPGQPVSSYNESQLYVGGELSKRQGHTLHYHAIGQVGLAGKAVGEFDVKGDIDLNFRLWKDTVSFIARGRVSNLLAPFYMRHYHSSNAWWDNDMGKEFRSHVEGELRIERWRTRLRASVDNIKNYTYFNELGQPAQKSGSLQVLSACLNQDFKLGIVHLDNEVIWQKSGDQAVLPLPDLSLYHNLYLKFKIAKVLKIELGADVRYFSKYKAPAYRPDIQQFSLQPRENQVELGGYPIVNVYANLHLKRTRFYVMMYHINNGSGNANSFLVPHYPINPRILKFGLSWNFFD